VTDRENELSGDAVKPMLDLQHRWVAALLKADTGALETILVDTYVDTDESGSRSDKNGILTALKSGDLKLASITLLETHVHRYGDSAILTGASAQIGSFQGQPIARRSCSPPPWFCKTGSGERLRHTEQPCSIAEVVSGGIRAEDRRPMGSAVVGRGR
jgi:hypothetical protein